MTPHACAIPLGMRGEGEARAILEVSWASWKEDLGLSGPVETELVWNCPFWR